MQDNFNVHEWNKNRYLAESVDPKDKEEEAKIGDNLYKKVTGKEPKVSTKNKLREPIKEGKNDYQELSDIINNTYNDTGNLGDVVDKVYDWYQDQLIDRKKYI